MKNLKYLAVGIVTSYVLCYVYHLTQNKRTDFYHGKERETFFSYDSDQEEGESSNT